MALPYTRLKEISDNFLFFDAEDLRETTAKSTLRTIAGHMRSINKLSENITLLKVNSSVDIFFKMYNFAVHCARRKFTFQLSLQEPQKYKFMTKLQNELCAKIFSCEFIYAYTLDEKHVEFPSNMDEIVIKSFYNIQENFLHIYNTYLERLIKPEMFLEYLYSDVKFYDAFQHNTAQDVEYILSKNPRCESYWNEYKKLASPFPVAQKRVAGQTYSMLLDSGASLLREGWSDVSESGVEAFRDKPEIYLPLHAGSRFLVALTFFSSVRGTLKVQAGEHELAACDLEAGGDFFSCSKKSGRQRRMHPDPLPGLRLPARHLCAFRGLDFTGIIFLLLGAEII